MGIRYSDTRDFEVVQLKDLFPSANRFSGSYPEKLQIAMKRYFGPQKLLCDSDSLICEFSERKREFRVSLEIPFSTERSLVYLPL